MIVPEFSYYAKVILVWTSSLTLSTVSALVLILTLILTLTLIIVWVLLLTLTTFCNSSLGPNPNLSPSPPRVKAYSLWFLIAMVNWNKITQWKCLTDIKISIAGKFNTNEGKRGVNFTKQGQYVFVIFALRSGFYTTFRVGKNQGRFLESTLQ